MTDDRVTPASLETLRQEIDGIDGEIHRLIKRRAEVVETLGAVKKAQDGGTGGQAMRPGREAQVLRRLAERHDGAFPLTALMGIWRTMMSAFLRMQHPIEVRVAAGDNNLRLWDLARVHFGAATPLQAVADANHAIAEARTSDRIVAVVPGPTPDNPWWRDLGEGGMMVLARLPVFTPHRTDSTEGFVVAAAAPEPSGDDVTWLRIDGPQENVEDVLAAWAAQAGLELSPVAAYNASEPQGAVSRLVAAGRYLDADDAALGTLKARASAKTVGVQRVGCFARPIDLPDEALT